MAQWTDIEKVTNSHVDPCFESMQRGIDPIFQCFVKHRSLMEPLPHLQLGFLECQPDGILTGRRTQPIGQWTQELLCKLWDVVYAHNWLQARDLLCKTTLKDHMYSFQFSEPCTVCSFHGFLIRLADWTLCISCTVRPQLRIDQIFKQIQAPVKG